MLENREHNRPLEEQQITQLKCQCQHKLTISATEEDSLHIRYFVSLDVLNKSNGIFFFPENLKKLPFLKYVEIWEAGETSSLVLDAEDCLLPFGLVQIRP